MGALYCSCEEQHQIWGEFWWVEGKYVWRFFDDDQMSETYAQQLTHCPTCSLRIERMDLNTVKV